MHPVKISRLSLSRALEIKNELITDGLILYDDFTWRWLPHIAYSDYTATSPNCVEFEFCKPAVATFYQLKWT